MERLGLAIFVGMGLFMSAVAELYRRNRDKAAAYDREAALRESQARLAAFAEAAISIGHGIRSRELMRGMEKLLRKYEGVVVGGCDMHNVLLTMKTELTQEMG